MNLLGISFLNKEDIMFILNTAKIYKEIFYNKKDFKKILQGKIVINLFFEASTRTRTSFEIAAKNLGGQVINMDTKMSSLKKGETIEDMVQNLEQMHPSAFIVRHPNSGFPFYLSKKTSIPVINAGDGVFEHPSQALLDFFTMWGKKKKMEGIKLSIIGDISHSRVARSNIFLQRLFKGKVIVFGPKTMIPSQIEKLGIKVAKNLREACTEKDFIMPLRIQLERKSEKSIPSLSEYYRYFALKEVKDAYILHPGPVNKNVEIDNSLLHHSHSLIREQVENGIFVRMAIFNYLLK
ncbi:MAG: aspartate carbamoyltransferase catalytic subunit [Deltaproteobacteria bacterium]|nr:aspartate carbamoyltransferase catalytic subunit [Deltaproteobacteria bacterium]